MDISSLPDGTMDVLENNLLVPLEGKKYQAYRDSRGVWTIGIGSTSGVYPGMTITEDQLQARYLADTATAVHGVLAHLDQSVTLTKYQMAPLISFTFNEGVANFASSSLLRDINNGNFDAVPDDFRKFDEQRIDGTLVFCQGLLNRRNAEIAVWNKVDDDSDSDSAST